MPRADILRGAGPDDVQADRSQGRINVDPPRQCLHGSVPRRAPGYRVSIIQTFCRWYGYMHQQIAPTLSPEAFTRNPQRFNVLTGSKPMDGYGSDQNRIVVLTPFG
jgi:hypothetical protein